MNLALLTSACWLASCGRADPPRPEIAIVGESTRLRLEDDWSARTPWFDGERVRLIAARNETIGIQVLHREAGAASLIIRGVDARIEGFDVQSFIVHRPSTTLYGGSHGAGTYPDALTPAAAPSTNPAYFEIAVARDALPGAYGGELAVAGRHIPVALTIEPVTLPPLALSAWAYEDPRELAWASHAGGDPPPAKPTREELACIALFRAHGVLLSPDLHADWWPERRELMAGVHDVPVWIPSDPVGAARAVERWIALTRGTGQVPFAIPVDEPRSLDKKRLVHELATAVRAAGGGPTTFQYALTDDFRPDFAGRVDLYITLAARRDDQFARWTYNGAPPHAGSMVLDAETPGTRTWGWIAWRWKIPTWYIWDALYWHDRHNRRGRPLPGAALDPRREPVSFDDGEDRGNLDGVLALPAAAGCNATLRLAAVRRGFFDKALLEAASRCAPQATADLAARVVPRALGDAPAGSARAWSVNESDWELARRELLDLASCPATPSSASAR